MSKTFQNVLIGGFLVVLVFWLGSFLYPQLTSVFIETAKTISTVGEVFKA